MNRNMKKTAEIESIKDLHIGRLKEVVEEVEILQEKKREMDHHINALLSSAELLGFSKKILKRVILMRKRSKEEIDEEETALQQVYQLLSA